MLSQTNGIRQEGVYFSGALKHKSRTISHLLMESVGILWENMEERGRLIKSEHHLEGSFTQK